VFKSDIIEILMPWYIT